jgi:hypothetical protein
MPAGPIGRRWAGMGVALHVNDQHAESGYLIGSFPMIVTSTPAQFFFVGLIIPSFSTSTVA